MGHDRDKKLITEDEYFYAKKIEIQHTLDNAKNEAAAQLYQAYQNCPWWLKWVCFPTLSAAELAASAAIDAAYASASVALNQLSLAHSLTNGDV